eukprot:SAG31_NODE_2500_length_5595_cov_4.571143_2_plen_196_part_00
MPKIHLDADLAPPSGTPLAAAIRGHHLSTVRWLINAGASATAPCQTLGGLTPLELASAALRADAPSTQSSTGKFDVVTDSPDTEDLFVLDAVVEAAGWTWMRAHRREWVFAMASVIRRKRCTAELPATRQLLGKLLANPVRCSDSGRHDFLDQCMRMMLSVFALSCQAGMSAEDILGMQSWVQARHSGATAMKRR